MFEKPKVSKKQLEKQLAARKLVTQTKSKSAVSEQFRTLRTNINFSMPDVELKTLLFTSAAPGEGKSTISSNTAIVYAQQGKKVLMIDGDMRKPTAQFTFAKRNTQGLSSLLGQHAEIKDVIQRTGIENLDLLTSGPIPPNPAELLGSKMMDNLMEQLMGMYDLLIFDAPPVLTVTDAQILSNKCDGTILVLSAGETEKDNALKAKEALLSSQANILGAVLNNFAMPKDHYIHQYYPDAE